MKRVMIIILLLLVSIPNIYYAKCDNNKHQEGVNEAKNITTDIEYSKSTKKFTLTIYNVTNKMYANYNNSKYTPIDGKIIIKNLSEGLRITVDIYISDGCDSPVDSIKLQVPYYNTFYGTAKCHDYENILTMCNSEFTAYRVTQDTLDLAINNYKNQRIEPPKEEEIIIEEKTISEIIIEFTKKWGIKIALFTGSTLISLAIGSIKYRKELHGV